jgi:hypothetical protein
VKIFTDWADQQLAAPNSPFINHARLAPMNIGQILALSAIRDPIPGWTSLNH